MLSAEERAVLAVLHTSAPRTGAPTYPPLLAPFSSSAAAPIRVRVFTPFCTGTEAVHRLERNCESLLLPGGGGGGRAVLLTAGEDYTHAVVVNDAMPDLPPSVPRHHVLGLAQEPTPYLRVWTPEHRRFAAARIGRYLVGSLTCPRYPLLPPLAPPFKRHQSYLWYWAPATTTPTLATKTRIMSFMVSNANNAPGHVYRRVLAQRILDTTLLPVHFYGSGCALLRRCGGRRGLEHPFYHPATGSDARLRGAFKHCDEMLDAYLFHVCIENFCAGLGDDVGEYFSEKVIDPLVRETIPVYLGSAAVESAFPGSTVALTGNLDRDLAIIAEVCRRPLDHLRRVDVGAVKRHCNFLYHLPRLFAEMEEQEHQQARKNEDEAIQQEEEEEEEDAPRKRC